MCPRRFLGLHHLLCYTYGSRLSLRRPHPSSHSSSLKISNPNIMSPRITRSAAASSNTNASAPGATMSDSPSYRITKSSGSGKKSNGKGKGKEKGLKIKNEPDHGAVYFWRDTHEETGWLSQWYMGCPFTDEDGVLYLSAEHYMMYHKFLLFNPTGNAAADAIVTGPQILSSPSPKTVKSLGRKITPFDAKVWDEKKNEIVEGANWWKFTRPVYGEALSPPRTGRTSFPINSSASNITTTSTTTTGAAGTGTIQGSGSGSSGGSNPEQPYTPPTCSTTSTGPTLSSLGGLRAMLLATGQKRLIEASPMDRIWGIGYGEKKAKLMRGKEGEEKWGQNLLGKALEVVRGWLAAEMEE